MKVTKIISTYVHDSVHRKFQPKLDALWADYNAKRDAVRSEIQLVVDEANEKAKAIAERAGFTVDAYRSDGIIYMSGFVGDRDIEEELRKKEREIWDERSKIEQGILLRLELGQTNKEELEDVLASIEV